MFVGTLVHELLQTCLRERVDSAEKIEKQLDILLQKQSLMQDMISLEMSLNDVRNEVDPFLPHILFFIKR